jgi:hypothetical protein
MDMGGLKPTPRTRDGHQPTASPHPDQLALVRHIVDDQAGQTRKHHIDKLVDLQHVSARQDGTLLYHRKRDRADFQTVPLRAGWVSRCDCIAGLWWSCQSSVLCRSAGVAVVPCRGLG